MNYKGQYIEYLQSDKWAKKRIGKAQESNYLCEKCGRYVPKGFHIHHKTYEHFGDEPMIDLMFLCSECHINLHCDIQVSNANKKKKKNKQKHCYNCYYSQVMKYKLKNGAKNVLWCNKYDKSCEDGVCKFYSKGADKVIQNKKKKKESH